ncbi:MAG: hypothetical protein EXS10_10730 [Phycisphaerales bacterium]|nr:hypothetical protein [Phycisphaerales bacterium]
MNDTQPTSHKAFNSDRVPHYPTLHLLASVVLVSFGLLAAWTFLKVGGSIDAEVYHAGLLGLGAAFFGNLMGALFGGWMVESKGAQAAWLASTVLRFLITPAAAVSLYFSAPVRPKPLLFAALAAYLILLFADAATMLKYGSRAKN